MKNIQHQGLVNQLKQISAENNIKLWKRVAEDLEKPTRARRIVNLTRINRFAKENETVVVPGKVLANGELTRKVVVAAHNFSSQAVRKIRLSGGTAMGITELLQKNPKGEKVRIIG